MLKNYIKIAIKVLLRRKFFTFISLFGISFTLMILMVITAFIEQNFGANYPEYNRDKTLYVSKVKLTNTKEQSSWQSAVGYHFYDNYLRKMKTPAKISLATLFPNRINVYHGTQKMKLFLKYTDAPFWEINQFQFTEGKSINATHIKNGEKVAIINESTKQGYFGKTDAAIGKFIEIGAGKYKVIGVVKSVPINRMFSAADVYIPYTNNINTLKDKSLIGDHIILFLANSKADLPKIREEFEGILSNVTLPEHFTEISAYADTFTGSISRNLGLTGDKINPIYIIASIFGFLFMLLPTINLVNLNITRIMERSSEIGVRKAFGASSSRLIWQFLIENIIITLIGGLISILLTAVLINILNNSGIIPHLDLSINLKVLTVSLLTCLFFGVISGVLPAYRMSKMNVVNALKAGEN
jgi:putative ABC transport system permease protein